MRTCLVLLALTLTSLMGTDILPAQVGANRVKTSISPNKGDSQRSLSTRRMDEMTSREVELYLEGGGGSCAEQPQSPRRLARKAPVPVHRAHGEAEMTL